MIGALIPAIASLGSALFGSRGGKSGADETEALIRSLMQESRPLLTQSLQRQQQMSPLYDAVLRMVGGQLPSWAGLDLGALLQPQQAPRAAPRRSLGFNSRANTLGVR